MKSFHTPKNRAKCIGSVAYDIRRTYVTGAQWHEPCLSGPVMSRGNSSDASGSGIETGEISIPVFFVRMIDHKTAEFQFAPPLGTVEITVSDETAARLTALEFSKFELRPFDSEKRDDAVRVMRNAAHELHAHCGGMNRTSDELEAAADWLEGKR